MKRALLAFLGLALLVTSSLATTLLPGSSIAGPAPLGSNPITSLTFVTSVGGAWTYPSPPDPTPGSGTYVESVYKDAGGHLVFAFQVQNNGPDIVETLTTAKWTGVLSIDAEQWKGGASGWATGSLAGKPATISMHSGVIRWSMNPDLNAGGTSYVLLLYTDATHYAPGSFTLQDGGTSTNPGLVPAPEPATFALLGVGLAGLGTLRKLKR